MYNGQEKDGFFSPTSLMLSWCMYQLLSNVFHQKKGKTRNMLLILPRIIMVCILYVSGSSQLSIIALLRQPFVVIALLLLHKLRRWKYYYCPAFWLFDQLSGNTLAITTTMLGPYQLYYLLYQNEWLVILVRWVSSSTTNCRQTLKRQTVIFPMRLDNSNESKGGRV